ncbi:hypothetical protein [Bacillus sp. JJ1474]|uniref:hypothetical protein n=1 Tax=Bacillus sp. JJ1474 TaxID=3122955 RepID=UPI002FFE2697
MKLGQEVRFNKCLVKGQDAASFNYLTPEQEKELEDTCQLKIKKLVEKEFDKHKTGIVVGKRRVGIETTLEEAQSYEGDFLERFSWYATTYDTVFLVACDIRGFYRVMENDLEVIS